MSRTKWQVWILGCFLLPGVAFAQVDFQQPPQDPGAGMHPADRNKAEMMEKLKKARENQNDTKRLETRRERMRQNSKLKSNAGFDAEFRKHFKRLARLMRISEVADETGNATLKARAQKLIELESARHRRVMKQPVRTAP